MVEEIKNPIDEIEVQAEEVSVVDEVNNSNDNSSQEETYKEMSPLRLVVRRFFRSKLSIVGVVMIIGLFIFSFFGPLVCRMTGYGKAWTEDAWQLNGSIETKADRREITSIVQEYFYYTDPETGKEYPILQEVEITRNLNAKASPSKDHFLGTDSSGYDIFVRLMYGGRISLAIGFIVVILETILGVILGGIAGYFGKWVDQIIMRIVDVFNCIPTLPILLIASALLDSWHINDSSRIYWLMVIITIFGWSGTARMVRGQILSLREQEYITATEVMGLPTWRKIFKHLIPNVMPQLIVSMTLGLGSVILYESTLSYLGLGVQMPLAAWGTMISGCNDPVVLRYYSYMWLPAGFLIVIAVLGFNFVGDGLRDAMDPKAKK